MRLRQSDMSSLRVESGAPASFVFRALASCRGVAGEVYVQQARWDPLGLEKVQNSHAIAKLVIPGQPILLGIDAQRSFRRVQGASDLLESPFRLGSAV